MRLGYDRKQDKDNPATTRSHGKQGRDMRVLPLISQIAEAASVAEVWQISTAFFAAEGFARANYGFTRFRHDHSIGNPDDALFLTSLDQDYASRYFSDGFYARTPVYKWAERNTGSCTWAWVRQALLRGELSADEMDAVSQNAAMGITAGITVSFPEISVRAKGALGLIADPGLTEADVEIIHTDRRDALLAVAHMMHLKIMQLPIRTRRRALTNRQREALEWVADGKTTQDVALLMSVSPAMVEKHLRLAREALDVDTTAQAVAKASMLNMIFQGASV